MANHEINPNEFSTDLRKLETTDRAHADTFNPLFEQLINNDAALRASADIADGHMTNSDIHVTAEQKQAWNEKAPNVLASSSKNGLLMKEDKEKLDTVAIGAEVNQNAIASVKAGNVTVQANGKSTQMELVAGSNVSITGDNSTKKVTITSNIPSSLPANGGNADTVDGVHIQVQTTVPTSLGNNVLCFVYE